MSGSRMLRPVGHQVQGYIKVTLNLDEPIPLEDRGNQWLTNPDMTVDEVRASPSSRTSTPT